ncbi:hypothetical protein B0T17DRAFT_512196 [Bombardia bombarda]|uniref:Uncharacterized protein n=1 Tax=Bombardia bombarda TaxID=252184 RepID=A0AA39W463_9PEZI|nr:hypothetical protein B0T17DRAFT_512196 [Bombardia bombarda]
MHCGNEIQVIFNYGAPILTAMAILLFAILPTPELVPDSSYVKSIRHQRDMHQTNSLSSHLTTPLLIPTAPLHDISQHFSTAVSALTKLLQALGRSIQHWPVPNAKEPDATEKQFGLLYGLGAIAHILCVVLSKADQACGLETPYETRLIITFRQQLLEYHKPRAMIKPVSGSPRAPPAQDSRRTWKVPSLKHGSPIRANMLPIPIRGSSLSQARTRTGDLRRSESDRIRLPKFNLDSKLLSFPSPRFTDDLIKKLPDKSQGLSGR